MKFIDIISEERHHTPEQIKAMEKAKKILSVFKSGKFTFESPLSDKKINVKYRLLDTPHIWYSNINRHPVIELTEQKWESKQPLFEFIVVQKDGEEILVSDPVVYSTFHMSIGNKLRANIEKFNIGVLLTQIT